jgi:hypothetical protein
MNRMRILAVAAALAAIPAVTLADDKAGTADAAWELLTKRFDLDADGRITWEEYQKVVTGFAGLDKDKDGVLTKDEIPADAKGLAALLALGSLGDGAGATLLLPPSASVSVLTLGDEDGLSGGVTTNLDAANTPRVAVLMLGTSADANKDGAVTGREWDAFIVSLRSDPNGVIPSESLQKALHDVPAGAAGLVLTLLLDADKDGKVEVDDLRAVFAAADGNQDGRVDMDDQPSKGAGK